MKEMLENMLKVEENLLIEFQSMIYVGTHSNTQSFITKKYERLLEKIMEELEELKLYQLTDRGLEFILNQLHKKVDVITFEEYAYNEKYLLSPFFRLFNQIQLEWVRRIYEWGSPDIWNEDLKFLYYDILHNWSLLSSYFKVCELLSDKMYRSYLGVYYYMMYTFPSIDGTARYQFDVKDWLDAPGLSLEEFTDFQKQEVSFLLENLFEQLNSISLEEIKYQFSYNDFYFYVYTYFYLARKHFTFQELNDKIELFMKDEGKRDYIQKQIETESLPRVLKEVKK